MFRRIKNLKFIGKDKDEVYVSMLLVIVGFLISIFSSTHGSGMFYVPLATCSCFVLAFFCALNATRDTYDASPKERALINDWFCIASILMVGVFAVMIMGTLQYLGFLP